jgi:hypothetical protein
MVTAESKAIVGRPRLIDRLSDDLEDAIVEGNSWCSGDLDDPFPISLAGVHQRSMVREPSIVAGDGQIDLFHAACWTVIQRWTSTGGVQFTQSQLPNNDVPTSVSAGRDAVGNLYVASERYTTAFEDLHSSVQTSADGWTHGIFIKTSSRWSWTVRATSCTPPFLRQTACR